MSAPRISLEQWRALTFVVESGGYAQAAESLHKSQSSITYAAQRIEALLGVQAFEIQGRKAVLTAAGQVLYRLCKALVDEATRLERAAAQFAAGREAQVRLAVDASFPTWLLLDCFAEFARERPEMHIELYEAVLSGTDEALVEGRVDLAIGSSVPAGFVGEALMNVRFVDSRRGAGPGLRLVCRGHHPPGVRGDHSRGAVGEVLKVTHRAVAGTVHRHESVIELLVCLVLVAGLAVRAPLVRGVIVLLVVIRLVTRNVR
jgi:DNA-binding transcriptional LysR family regulator